MLHRTFAKISLKLVCSSSYNNDKNTIELCYELGIEERKMFTEDGDSGVNLENELYQSDVGTLFHEAGHALIANLI